MGACCKLCICLTCVAEVSLVKLDLRGGAQVFESCSHG